MLGPKMSAGRDMRKHVIYAVLAAGLVGLGWTVGRAQSPTPDFEVTVEASGTGEGAGATITCIRGCSLVWAERGINPNSRPQPTFHFGCNGAGVEHCNSGRIAGWVSR
jgi:hypothetical protein